MSDRGEDRPLAPRRTLSGPSSTTSTETSKPTITERVSAAVTATGSAVQQAISSSGPTEAPPRQAAPPSRPGHSAAPARRPRVRRARLRLVHIDPWSVMKTAFLLSVALGIVLVVAVGVVWSVLGAAGVWTSINSTVTNVLGSGSASNFNVENYVGTSRVLGFTMIVAVIDVILITAIATLGAFLYNLAAALLGGLEVVFAEDDR